MGLIPISNINPGFDKWTDDGSLNYRSWEGKKEIKSAKRKASRFTRKRKFMCGGKKLDGPGNDNDAKRHLIALNCSKS